MCSCARSVPFLASPAMYAGACRVGGFSPQCQAARKGTLLLIFASCSFLSGCYRLLGFSQYCAVQGQEVVKGLNEVAVSGLSQVAVSSLQALLLFFASCSFLCRCYRCYRLLGFSIYCAVQGQEAVKGLSQVAGCSLEAVASLIMQVGANTC